MVNSKLNSRQQRFVYNIVAGMSQHDAYIKAGYSTEGADPGASELIRLPKVVKELERLYKLAEAPLISNVANLDERMAILAEIARHKIELPVSAGQKLAAVAEMNKVEGTYAPTKHLVGHVQFDIEFTERKQIEEPIETTGEVLGGDTSEDSV